MNEIEIKKEPLQKYNYKDPRYLKDSGEHSDTIKAEEGTEAKSKSGLKTFEDGIAHIKKTDTSKLYYSNTDDDKEPIVTLKTDKGFYGETIAGGKKIINEDLEPNGAENYNEADKINKNVDKGNINNPNYIKYLADSEWGIQELSIFAAQRSNKEYTENFDNIKAEQKAVVANTLLVSSLLMTGMGPGFTSVIRECRRSQCKQSIYNFPINPKRVGFNFENIRKNLEEIGEAIKNRHGIIDEMQKHSRKQIKFSDGNEVLKIMSDAGAVFAKEIVFKATQLFKTQLNENKYGYPSVYHSLSDGDYTEIFAFNLLMYLYKIDKNAPIESEGKYDQEARMKEVTIEDVYPYDPGAKGSEQEKREPRYALSGDKGKGEFNMKVLQGGSNISTNVKKGSKGSYTRSFGWTQEPTHQCILRPTRTEKIMLLTDPTYFMYQITPQISKGLALLCKLKILPEQTFTRTKICSRFSGAIYDISITKKGLKLSLDNKLRSFASMDTLNWGQYSLFVDCKMLSQINEVHRNTVEKIRKTYPWMYWKAWRETSRIMIEGDGPVNSQHPNVDATNILTGALHLPIDYAMTRELTESEHEEVVEILEGTKALLCNTRRAFSKAITENARKTYETRVVSVIYPYAIESMYMTKNLEPTELTDISFEFYGKEYNKWEDVPKLVLYQIPPSNDVTPSYVSTYIPDGLQTIPDNAEEEYDEKWNSGVRRTIFKLIGDTTTETTRFSKTGGLSDINKLTYIRETNDTEIVVQIKSKDSRQSHDNKNTITLQKIADFKDLVVQHLKIYNEWKTSNPDKVLVLPLLSLMAQYAGSYKDQFGRMSETDYLIALTQSNEVMNQCHSLINHLDAIRPRASSADISYESIKNIKYILAHLMYSRIISLDAEDKIAQLIWHSRTLYQLSVGVTRTPHNPLDRLIVLLWVLTKDDLPLKGYQ